MNKLIVIPCGSAKIWSKDPNHGPARARDAYVGVPFKVNRAYAEASGARWLILSAKYGFIDPDFAIPGPYEVTFKRKSTNPISVDVLKQQAKREGLLRYAPVVVLGGKEYRAVLAEVFRGLRVEFPFAGLSLGKGLQAIKRATTSS